ncbi:MAG: Rne/Rng family ribonuclease [Desulfobacterales bacterium]|nr:Rne/Rng family ribonuclease [Desulfobacterales bacterium]
MFRKLVISVTDHETRVALLEDGTISELFVERRDESGIAGNIYKGRVQRVLPGMQAAFIDVGLNQAAFVYVKDLYSDKFKELEELFSNDDEEDACETIENANEDETVSFTPETEKDIPIGTLLKEGQEILVQVAKSPIGTKGARVTSYISLPGRYLVYMPNSDHIGISRRIEDEGERNRLKDCVLALRQNNAGYIVRTAAEGESKEKLAHEMDFLNNLWAGILSKYKNAMAPSSLHQELAVSLRAVRDLLTQEAEKILIDSREGYDQVLSFLDDVMPELKENVELYEGKEPLFDAYNLEGDISRALKKKVWLKSGSYIVIEHTEALVAIDVNTGRYVGKHNLEETILKTNLEAVKEIAYQLRLRDIGGIIIIDFIDMMKKSNQEKVYNALQEAILKDRSKTHILPISELGLIQMTRKRVKKSLTRMLCEPCFYCDGEGTLMSKKSICYNIFRDIVRDSQDLPGIRIGLRTNPEIAELLHGEENRLIANLERVVNKQIVIYPNADYHLEQFDVFGNVK